MIKQRLLQVNGGHNFRDLGGYKTTDGKTVKWHRILRTGKLANLKPSDLSLLDQYHVRHDVDFRSKAEVKLEPDRLPTGADYTSLPVFREDMTDSTTPLSEQEALLSSNANFGRDQMMEAYKAMVTTTEAQESYRTFFDLLLSNNDEQNAILFHCTAGKDRTGMGAVFLLNALGVDEQQIKQDYLYTNEVTADYLQGILNDAKKKGMNQNFMSSVQSLFSVSTDYYGEAVNTIDRDFGGMQNYLHSVLKLQDNEIRDLKRLYLD
ncbi:protein-tyrosine phosphatase [Secundilactobacillus oryzae JCM 18671]|uniref:Protein-tyrosine phosphatase n=2 Tax=Secundilactobacillus oryzae TaxID=1202668 RepID=A0A081BGX4_9LACO|nr:tyrosine-protein phosphatase [Secundilactobacillus oryzae]GAK47292.1 protein-tyrosine phosphatase [Secundilactobacillus oryzae JCM 18671]